MRLMVKLWFIYVNVLINVFVVLGMVARHGSYGSEAIQALLDNITLPEFRGNLIIILAGD